MRFHVNPESGQTGECNARPGHCPLKPAGSPEPEHYPTKEAAQKAAENMLSSRFSQIPTSTRNDKKFYTVRKTLDNGEIWDVDSDAHDTSAAAEVLDRVMKRMTDKNGMSKANLKAAVRFRDGTTLLVSDYFHRFCVFSAEVIESKDDNGTPKGEYILTSSERFYGQRAYGVILDGRPEDPETYKFVRDDEHARRLIVKRARYINEKRREAERKRVESESIDR